MLNIFKTQPLFLLASVIAIGSAIVHPTACYAGPFGLEAGMSRTDVIQKIGKNAILKETKDDILFSTVPMRSIYFESYDCFFDPNGKLWSIHASSLLPTNSDGEDLRDSFEILKSSLENKYGKPLYVTGSKNSGVKWLSLNGIYPVFTGAYWDGSSDYSKSAHISKIRLEVTRANINHGFLELEYQFDTLLEGPL